MMELEVMEEYADRIEDLKAFSQRICTKYGLDSWDADDVRQNTALSIFRSNSSWNGSGEFKSWYGAIVSREANRFRQKKYRTVNLPDSEEILDHIEDHVDWSPVIRYAISLLPDPYDAIMKQFYIEDLNSEKIGENLDMPPGTVRRKLCEGRDKLKLELEVQLDAA